MIDANLYILEQMMLVEISKKYRVAACYLFLLPVLFVMASCSDEDDKIPAGKGATTAIMQRIADNTPYIQSVEKDSSYVFRDGIEIIDTRFTYCTKPTRMIIAKIDLNKVTLATCTAYNENKQTKLQPIAEQAMDAEKAGKKVLVGINGDYFGWSGVDYISQNVFYKDGIVINDHAASGFNGIVSVQKNGSVRITSMPEFQQLKSEVTHAIGGWQRMVEKGKIGTFAADQNSMEFHPRTFVGISKDNMTFYMFVLDGRQPEYSNGMRVSDMGLVCLGAGCYEAVNLDGGGSSTFVCRNEENGALSFKILNIPSDNPARAVLNGLLVVEK